MKRNALYLERVLLKELPLGSDPDEKNEIDRLRGENREILERYTADSMRRAVEAKLAASRSAPLSGNERPRRATLRFPLSASAVIRFAPMAAAACIALAAGFVYLGNPAFQNTLLAGQSDSGNALGIRAKGSAPNLSVYRKAADGAERLANGSAARMNDVLQLRYYAGTDSWGAILSVDGNGIVTQHFPDSGDQSGPLDGSGEIALPFSYRLDDAPKFERFIFVSGRRTFSLDSLKHDLSNLAKIHPTGTFALDPLLPGGTRETDVLLRK